MDDDVKIEPTILYNDDTASTEAEKVNDNGVPEPRLSEQHIEGKAANTKTKILAICVSIFGVCTVTLAVVLAFVLSNTNSEVVVRDSGLKEETPLGNSSIDMPKQRVAIDLDSSHVLPASPESGNIADRVRGNKESDIVVIEYADMQCPGCAAIMAFMDDLFSKYGDKVAFVYRHYSISSHANARSAAIAVEAAGEQGYFWEMLNETYSRRSEWMALTGTKLSEKFANIFEDVAGEAADIAKYSIDLKSSNVAKKVDNDKAVGNSDFAVSATPTIIVGGKKVDFGSGTLGDAVKKITDAIEAELK